MRGNQKKRRKTKSQTRNSRKVENIQQLSNTSKYDYMSGEYNHEEYSNQVYYKKDVPSAPRKINSPSPNTQHMPKPTQGRTTTRKNKKKKTKFFIGRIVFLISFIVGVIYIIGIVVETTQKPVISYQMVQRGVIDNSEVFEGLIVRNEAVIPNTKEGNMYLIAAEGEKVKKDGKVYQILDSADSSLLEKDIQNIESDIEKVQVKRKDISYYQNEIQEINNMIDNYMEIYHMQSDQGELIKTHELKRQLEYEIVKRKNVHMKDSATALNDLKDQKEDLASQLIGNGQVYKSGIPGIISYYTDGVEGKFTFDNIGEIVPEDMKGKYTNISTTANQIIQANEPAYRLIKDTNWKMVSFIPEKWATNFRVGESHSFVLMGDEQVEFTVKVEANTPKEKNHKVVFTSNEQLDVFAMKRIVDFKSLHYKYEGLKIPSSSIIERNLIKIPSEYIVDSENGKGVMKPAQDSDANLFVGLNIQYEDSDGNTYVPQNLGEKSELKLGDSIMHPSKDKGSYIISEVSSVKGVYVVNGRITKFKPISIMAKNEEYVIVKPNSMNGLKQFDQIVTNPKNIEEEQLLRNMDVKNIKK